MMRTSASHATEGDPRPVALLQNRPSRRRRTLGLCAHCHEPVEVGSEHVRLYRLAWHLDCALAPGGPAARMTPPD